MAVQIPKHTAEDVKGYEFRHAFYTTDYNKQNDLLFVKEYVHLKDGTKYPRLRKFFNKERSFWVTKPAFRNHSEKKEWEDIDKLTEFRCTQAKMPDRIAAALDYHGANKGLRTLARSPYLYGVDITPISLMKHAYETKFPDCLSIAASVCAYDIETDVVNGTNEIILIGVTFKDKVALIVNEAFMAQSQDNERRIRQRTDELLEKYVKERNIKLDIYFYKTPGQCAEKSISLLHEWMPDFVSIFNINFDLPIVVEALKKEGYDLDDVFCDPSVPKAFRSFVYNEDEPQKVTQANRASPKNDTAMWHTVSAPASFVFIDSMALYYILRMAAGREAGGYSLDAVLTRNLGLTKLKFTETDHLSKVEWHRKMQSEYKVEYCVYNIFDCIALELLDEKIKDISQSIRLQVGYSRYEDFNSGPRKLCDDIHFFCLKHGKVVGSTSNQMRTELDDLVLNANRWIVTLPAHMVEDIGISAIDELPDVKSLITTHNSDLDIRTTYPCLEDICNISKETTYREFCKIEGQPESEVRKFFLNLTGGSSNALQLGTQIFKLPTPGELLDQLLKDTDSQLVSKWDD